ncbi:pentapeptide repeat-containing protein [Actinoplanes sp. NBC_00393]|uniref:pentapeptide repeat-containing protein n=1 Tax=Actinoplanes sp. NBC_00393 TaxID=2975953 RepID=UPI003FA48D38
MGDGRPPFQKPRHRQCQRPAAHGGDRDVRPRHRLADQTRQRGVTDPGEQHRNGVHQLRIPRDRPRGPRHDDVAGQVGIQDRGRFQRETKRATDHPARPFRRHEAHLKRAAVHAAGLHAADQDSAGLRGSGLRGAGLRGAGLRGAGLRGARLGGAGLRGAGLRGARLRGARPRGAGLCAARQGSAGGEHLEGGDDVERIEAVEENDLRVHQ